MINEFNLQPIKRIHTTRSLNLAKIKTIGYDMDHTLAIYNRKSFEALAFDETVKKFIKNGYPEEFLTFKFDLNAIQRGLLVDRENGILLKADAHKYVKIAYKGHRKLSKQERHLLYNSRSFKAQDFVSVDTLFSLSEVQLFVEIVDFMVKNPNRIEKSYSEVYTDLRNFIDLSHRDGSIKNKVLANPELYFFRDEELANTLIRQIDGGKKLFLLTNSHWDYTNAVMTYLLDQQEYFSDWQGFFEYILVGGAKPGFFNGHQSFFEVDQTSGLMKVNSGKLKLNHAYHGGNAKLFEALTGYTGDEILYVGDHIFGDIKSSKDLFNWRTALVLDELEHEITMLEKQQPLLEKINKLFMEKEKLDEEYQTIRSLIGANYRKSKAALLKSQDELYQELAIQNADLEKKAANVLKILTEKYLTAKKLTKERQQSFHPVWGEMMKTGYERSRLAAQVEDYACIYTSRVSNFRFYNPNKEFLSHYDYLPHEQTLKKK